MHAFKAESTVSQSHKVNSSQSFVVSIAEWEGQKRAFEPNSKLQTDRDKRGPGEVGPCRLGDSKSIA